MKIAIIGAGAIGSVVAAYLTKSGQDVTMIGRSDQVDAINKAGLKIKGVRGEEIFKIKAQTALDREYDLAIFTTKTQDLEEAYRANAAFLKNSLILSSQNGVQADSILKQWFKPDQMLSSIVMFGSTYIKPGEIIFNFEGDWIVGKPFTANDQKLQDVVAVLKKAFSVSISENIIGMKWLKLFINFNNCIPATIGKSMQETFADMDLCRLSILLLKEGVGIVQKAGIELVSLPQFPKERILGLANMPLDQAAGIINKTLTSLSKEPLYGSILQSIMRGRESEIDYINGEVVRLAKQTNLEAPLNEKIVSLVHEVEKKQKFFDPAYINEVFSLGANK